MKGGEVTMTGYDWVRLGATGYDWVRLGHVELPVLGMFCTDLTANTDKHRNQAKFLSGCSEQTMLSKVKLVCILETENVFPKQKSTL